MKIIKSLLAVGLIALSPIAHARDKDMLDVKIGQMLMIGFPKAEVDPVLLEEIRAGKVGAVIFFEKNIPESASAFAPHEENHLDVPASGAYFPHDCNRSGRRKG